MADRLAMVLSAAEAEWLDRAAARGGFKSREQAVHAMLDRAMSLPTDEEIVAAYRRAEQPSSPEDEAWGRAGLALLSQRLQDDQR